MRPAISSSSVLISGPLPSDGDSLMDRASEMLPRPSVIATMVTWLTSPELRALSPIWTAWVSPCESGDPPPQGNVSRRRRAMAIERVGGSNTSARSPRNGMSATRSRCS